MPLKQHLENQMIGYFVGTLVLGLLTPLVIIPVVSMGDSGLNISIAMTVLNFAGIAGLVMMGNRSSKKLAEIPVKARFWTDEYEANYLPEQFLAVPLAGYHATELKVRDINHQIVATIPRHFQRAHEFEIGSDRYKISKVQSSLETHISIERLANHSSLIAATIPIRAAYELRVGDDMRLRVESDNSKRFPTRYFIFQDNEQIGLVDIKQRIVHQAIVTVLPAEWPIELRALVTTFFSAKLGK